MADFQFDIGDKIGDFEVVSRSENSLSGELQYTVISKAHADARRAEEKAAEEAAQIAAGEAPDTAPEDAAQAVASEEPEILHPRG